MTDKDQVPFDVRIKVHDLYLIILWDTEYFPGHEGNRRVCGVRVADNIFSLEAFASNSKPEYAIAQALAEKVRPVLSDQIKSVEENMKVCLQTLTEELNDPVIKAMDVVMPVPTEYPLTIGEGKGTPLVNAFVRLFVLADLIVASLKDLHFKGAITKKEWKKRENVYLKPLRKLMHDLQETIVRYHEQRKALTPK
ncbi:AcaB family transcriptional regulator [Pseudomonas syringae]|uniref:AcaB family transcriptional regulator n=1 Tax=Pseudomonas syringae TaxID=317 RepID=UPI00036C239F|nr:AcaB family transcriptional regulator [Pseudomonas syringae]MDU8540231.1 AcaB family transcriptional regulator [Pseudomonas syringae pv. actinidiae]